MVQVPHAMVLPQERQRKSWSERAGASGLKKSLGSTGRGIQQASWACAQSNCTQTFKYFETAASARVRDDEQRDRDDHGDVRATRLSSRRKDCVNNSHAGAARRAGARCHLGTNAGIRCGLTAGRHKPIWRDGIARSSPSRSQRHREPAVPNLLKSSPPPRGRPKSLRPPPTVWISNNAQHSAHNPTRAPPRRQLTSG
jgi:hypothetical protein